MISVMEETFSICPQNRHFKHHTLITCNCLMTQHYPLHEPYYWKMEWTTRWWDEVLVTCIAHPMGET